jgi:AcrR family transcriptional regulator
MYSTAPDQPILKHRPGRPVDGALRDRRCDEILEAATELFAHSGYSETTTEMLAERLGVGKGTIYRYFPTKRDLFLGAVDRLMRRLLATIDEAVETVDDPLDKMAHAIRTYLTFFVEHPEFVELIIQERAQFKDRKQPTYFDYRDANRERHLDFFRQLIAAGRVRDIPVDRVNDVVSDLVYGTMFANYFTGRRRSAADQAEEILDVVFRGILSDTERQRREATTAKGTDGTSERNG